MTEFQARKPLDEWKAQIKAGVRYRSIYGKSKDWERYKTMYRGYWGKGVVPVNIIYAIGRSMIPQIYFRNPRVSVYPRLPGYAPHAWMLERIDNYLIGELQLKRELKMSALDCYLCGRGPMIYGYDSEWGFNPSFLSEEFEDASLTSFDKKGQKIEYNLNVKPGMPWMMRCNPADFIVPWGTASWEEAPWYAMRKMRALKDIKEDPKYSNTGGMKGVFKTKLDSSNESKPANQGMHRHEMDEAAEWVELWEIHDQRTGRVFTLSFDHDKFVRNEIDYLQVEGLPAGVLGFNDDPDYFWWAPDARMIEVQQLEINDVRTMARAHRRVALLKVLYDKGMVRKEEMAKLLDGDPKAAVGIDAGASGDIRKAVQLFQSHVPPDLISASREIREDIREIVGFSRNQMGAFEAPSGRRTAHEAEIVRAASMIRIDERRDMMADFLEHSVRKLNQIIFEQWSEERVIDIVGPDGAKYWVRFTGNELRGEFAYKVNPEEAVPEDRRTRQMEVEKFMEIAGKVPGIDMRYLVEQWSRQFEWVDHKMLFPQSEGEGRSPEKAMMFHDFMRKMGAGGGGGQSQFPQLAEQGGEGGME